MLLLTALLAAAVFEVSGRVTPQGQAAVSLHSATTPYVTSTISDHTGRFRLKRVPQGTYTLSVFFPTRGELKRTIEVGPGTADGKGRVNVNLVIDDARLDRSGAGVVSARELVVPDAARRAYSEAQRLLSENRVEDAVRRLERAVEIEPRFAAAWNHLGTIAYHSRQFERAAECFEKALRANPDAYAPLVNLGGVLINLGQLEQALKLNEYAALKRPDDPLANSQLGMAEFALGQFDAAEKHLLKAVKLDPAHFSHPQLQLAELYLRRKQPARAAEQLEDFLLRHPDWPAAAAMREGIAKLRAQ